MTLDELIRILQAVAPVLAVMAVIAWLLFWLDRKTENTLHQYPNSQADGCGRESGETRNCPVANCSICGEGR
jgi:hypothetical protein